jgi:hypothetical protein
MPTRYQQLRQAIVHLGQSAEEQHAYLERQLGHLAQDGDASGYGNHELGLEFDDIFAATRHMQEWGEITAAEIAAAKPLDDMLGLLWDESNQAFWRGEALWSDPRWEQVRECARRVLKDYPDEERPSDWLSSLI